MPTETLNTRRHDRHPARLPVAYGPEFPTTKAFAETLSEGGMYINSHETYKVGTRLILQIQFPDRTIYQTGEVVWAIDAPEHMRDSMICGMGIQFVYADPTWPQFLRDWKQRSGVSV